MNPTSPPVSADDFRRLAGEVSDMKELMGQMTQALTRLALLEERQQSVTVVTGKILEQVEDIRKSQHGIELRLANYPDIQGRVQRLEEVVRDMHLEQQRDKASVVASLKVTKMFMTGAWAAVLALSGVVAFVLTGGA